MFTCFCTGFGRRGRAWKDKLSWFETVLSGGVWGRKAGKCKRKKVVAVVVAGCWKEEGVEKGWRYILDLPPFSSSSAWLYELV